jgi:molybdenum cofactor cytidylyltransferase
LTGGPVSGLGAVVLAAGASRRLGTPKQLLPFRGEPLVHRAAHTAFDAGFWPVVVVVGCRADEVRAALAGMPLVTVTNDAWEEGLGSSIRAGIGRLAECAPHAEGALLLACDQPLVEAAHLVALAASARAAAAPMAASAYGGTLGIPALFAACMFPELATLGGDAGARSLLGRDPARVAAVPLPGGELDVDTPDDWARALGARA